MTSENLLEYFRGQTDAFADTLQNFVNIFTPSGDVNAVNQFQDHLTDLFQDFQPNVDRRPTDHGDVLILDFFPEKTERILWLAHADTARISDEIRPARIEDGRLYGSGAYDMKNGLGIFYYTLKALSDLGLESKYGITLFVSCDEEIGSRASLPHLLEVGRRMKAVLLPEIPCPDGGMKTERKGVAAVEARLMGKAVHAGIEPENGLDANRALIRLILKIDKIVGQYPEVTFNPGLIKGGASVNTVSPNSELIAEMRSFSRDQLESALTEIREISAVNGVAVNLSAWIEHPVMEITEGNQRLYETAKCIAEDLNHTLPQCASGGASEGSHLSAAGIPVLDGLGMQGGNAHAPGEFVALADFPFRAALITRLTLELFR